MELFEGHRDLDEGPGLLQSAWRYSWLIAIATLLGALLGYAWEARQPTLYEGSTRLMLSIGSGVLPGDSGGPPQEPQRFLSNQAQVIASRPVLQLAAREVGGRVSPGILAERMTIEVADDADVITVRVRDTTAEGALRLAQAVGTAYNKFVLDQSADAAAAEAERLNGVAEDLNAQLGEISAALGADPGNSMLQARKTAVQEQLTATVARGERLRARAKTGVSPLQFQEPAAVPRQPVQPAPRRGVTAGLLLGLVASAGLAWWLNSRAAQRQSVQRRARPVLLEPVPELERSGERPDAVPVAGNGGPGAPGSLQRPRDPALSPRQDAGGSPVVGGLPTGSDVSAGNRGEDLRDILDRLKATLGGESLDWYLDNYPQVLAQQVTTTVYADMAAVLLDNAEGSFAVAGGFGLSTEEQDAVLEQSQDVLRQILTDGVGIFQDGAEQMPAAAAGLPGSQSAEALVVVPLAVGSDWIGMLLVGRRSANGHGVAAFDDQEIEHIIIYALEIAPTLHTLVLLDRLQGSLGSLKVSGGGEPTAPSAAG